MSRPGAKDRPPLVILVLGMAKGVIFQWMSYSSASTLGQGSSLRGKTRQAARARSHPSNLVGDLIKLIDRRETNREAMHGVEAGGVLDGFIEAAHIFSAPKDLHP